MRPANTCAPKEPVRCEVKINYCFNQHTAAGVQWKASFTQVLGEGTLRQMITAHVLISAACTRYAKKQVSTEKLRRENVKDCNYRRDAQSCKKLNIWVHLLT